MERASKSELDTPFKDILPLIEIADNLTLFKKKPINSNVNDRQLYKFYSTLKKGKISITVKIQEKTANKLSDMFNKKIIDKSLKGKDYYILPNNFENGFYN